MIVRTPNYFETFKCKAQDCKDSCCIGWELEIDNDTHELYKNLPGPFGDRIRSLLSTGDEDSCSFILPVDGRCPMLNDRNLCDIVLELGEESLCDICTNYPRYTFTYGSIVEKSLTISCEEACRLLLEEKEIIIAEAENEYPAEMELDPEDSEEPSEEDIKEFLKMEENIFNILKDRSRSLNERMEMIADVKSWEEYSSFGERLRILTLLEPINNSWLDILESLLPRLDQPSLPWKEDQYENLLIYFLFRYLPRGLFDGDYITKIRFAIFCAHAILDIEAVTGDLSLAASVFSRETEHSEENLEIIMEELMFS